MSNLSRQWVVFGLAAVVLLARTRSTQADIPDSSTSSDRNYQSIVDRNPFALRPLPPPAPPPGPPTNATASVKNNLKLTGFTTLRGKRAFFVWTEEKTKKPETFDLAIGQGKEGLQLVDVDAANRQVHVLLDGVPKAMTFATDGVTNLTAIAAATVPQGSVPGGVRPGNLQPGSLTPPPLPGAGSSTVPGAANPTRTIPSRNVRTGATGSSGAAFPGAAANTTVNPGYGTMPVVTPGTRPPPIPTPQPDRDADEQILLLELQRRLNPDLPPTPGLP